MARNTFAWQTDDNGLLVVEYEDVVAAFDDVEGSSVDVGAEAPRAMGFADVAGDLNLGWWAPGASLAVAADETTLVLRLSPGASSVDRVPHMHPRWAAAVRRLGYAPVVVSFGSGVLPDASTERLRRHAEAGVLLGALVGVSGAP